MPRGGRRPGAGRPPKSLQELRLGKTFRPHRHAHLVPAQSLAATAPMLDPTLPIPAVVLEGLADPGRRFVTAEWQEFEEWSRAELELLRLAAKLLDEIETTQDFRGRRLSMHLFARLVNQLGLDGRK